MVNNYKNEGMKLRENKNRDLKSFLSKNNKNVEANLY
jgi:hypothetical protein